MTIYGSEGATSEVKLEKGDEMFERAGTDLFRMELEDVGKLCKLRIGHKGKGNRNKWFLDKVDNIVQIESFLTLSIFYNNNHTGINYRQLFQPLRNF